MSLADDPLRYKDAVLYELHVKRFVDSDAPFLRGPGPGSAPAPDHTEHIDDAWSEGGPERTD